MYLEVGFWRRWGERLLLLLFNILPRVTQIPPCRKEPAVFCTLKVAMSLLPHCYNENIIFKVILNHFRRVAKIL